MPSAVVCAESGGRNVCTPTGADGSYAIRGLDKPVRHATASATGFKPAVAGGIEWRGTDGRADFTLMQGGAEVSGEVVDFGGGPVPGALVQLTQEGIHAGSVSVLADEHGRVRAWVDDGLVQVRGTAVGYVGAETECLASHEPFRLVLVPESVILGHVIARGGAPVGGVEVRVDPDVRVWTMADGSFQLDGLLPGRYQPTVRSGHWIGVANESVTLGLTERADNVIVWVDPALVVSGRIVRGDGQSCEGGQLAIDSDEAPADREGNVELGGLVSGRYAGFARCDGAPLVAFDLTLVDHSLGNTWRVDPGLTVKGRVRLGTVPLAGVRVWARQQRVETWTDADGGFALGLHPGTDTVYVDEANDVTTIPPEATPVEVTATGAPVLDLVAREGGAIAGRVVDAAGEPTMAMVTVGERSIATTDGGYFELGKLEPGRHAISADSTPPILVTVVASETRWVELRSSDGKGHASCAGELAGRVVDTEGKPVGDALVHADEDGGPAWFAFTEDLARRAVVSDEAGQFRLDGLCAAAHTVTAFVPGGGAGCSANAWPGGPPVVVVAVRPGRFEGTVLDASGRPSPEFSISVVGAQRVQRDSFRSTSGNWAIRGLIPGEYAIHAIAPEGEGVVRARVDADKTTRVELTLSGRARLHGIVVDDGGRPVGGMPVYVALADGTPTDSSGVADSMGLFAVEGVPTGSLIVGVHGEERFYSTGVRVFVRDAGSEAPSLRLRPRRFPHGTRPGQLGLGLATGPEPSCVIRDVVAGGPAARAGLGAGEVVETIDGAPIGVGSECSEYLVVPPGASVLLGLADGRSIALVAVP